MYKITLGYGWPSEYHVDELHIHIRYTCFSGEYMELAIYCINGICRKAEFLIGEKKLQAISRYGNRVLQYDYDKSADMYSNEIRNFIYRVKQVE